jgi:hypothetical protein
MQLFKSTEQAQDFLSAHRTPSSTVTSILVDTNFLPMPIV